uniref:Uncharacterized protein n=1 Tax=Calcidiscus leptoporus TaxID=127549 RepID=A0A7S0NWD1_9EUKA|mmetsp:Transcript_32110/g.74828  ORF Transcript_32110/g.74828 Transcript_32110/m.74828 type:complete len:102 (+) Transcript_32110:183-488(+)|eukprot:CAMPEP_0119356040 /NCGR_PEP_ID=MMETSP1334-20130426/4769_1 /TAXON_ID=127549 /ORGANISM="Calcidiscus leptoporus, Strain RCC1130" /LENGTH=101 /DNA_ID=CAMNT_0007369999 /DNA_START=183 /DNA_END=488 /DNA_ORIENTATION=+
MGCSGSKKSDHYKAEADAYAARKKNGFKDPELEKWRQDGIKQKKKLKHVPDPLDKKTPKAVQAKAQHNKRAKGPTPATGQPITGPSQNELKQARKNLKKKS